MAALTVELAQEGQVTLPRSLCEQHRWEAGQQFNVLDLDGVVVLSPGASQVDALANQLRDDLLGEDVTLEALLTGLQRLPE